MASAALLARLVTDGASDFQHFERFKGELSVMALGIGEASDAVGNGLVNGFSRGNYLHDVLMDIMMIRHSIPSSPPAGGEIMAECFRTSLDLNQTDSVLADISYFAGTYRMSN
jgi:hypothetical protein